MRRWEAWLLVLLAGLSGGCASARPDRARSLFNPFRAPAGPVGDDVLQMDIAVVERPVGDRYLNGELWDLADEQAVGFDRKAALEDNGFRVGLIGGMPPTGLQALLTSERSCANPRRVRTRSGNPTSVTLAGTQPQCRFELHQGGTATAVELEQAQCQLEVMPGLTEDGRVTLRFVPHVKHGETTLAPRPLQEPSGAMRWQLTAHQPDEAYERLSWEVTLAPNDYVLVGTRLERPDTLGQRCFLTTDGPAPVQRLLVIRTCRVQPSAPHDGGHGKPPPLAFQAGWFSARGVAP